MLSFVLVDNMSTKDCSCARVAPCEGVALKGNVSRHASVDEFVVTYDCAHNSSGSRSGRKQCRYCMHPKKPYQLYQP